MTMDNIPSNQDAGSQYTTGDSSVLGFSRAPRHVQWASKPQVEYVEHTLNSELDCEELEIHQRTLDAHGSDSAALAKDHRALESYLETHPLPSSDGLAPKKAKHTRRMTQTADAPGSALGSHPQAESSRQGRQPNEQDFDKHAFFGADEEDGIPMLASSRIQEVGKGDDVEVDVELHGLAQEKRWEKRARSLVRVHTRSLRWKAARMTHSKRWTSLPRFQNLSNGQLYEKTPSVHDRDPESNTDATRLISPLPRGQGVLSTLLTLYNAGGSVSSSPPASRVTTPSDGDQQSPAIPDELKECQTQRGAPTSYFDPHPSTVTSVSPLPDISAHPSSTSSPAKQKNTVHIPLPMPSSTPLSLHLSSPAKSIHLPTLHTPGTRGWRPKAATKAGGVVGSLIASLGNLTGAAAPAPSTIGPNVKKRGFGLSRYEIVPDASQLELHPINHRQTRSALATPQRSTTNHVDDVTPANGTSETRTPESASDANTSQTIALRKYTRNSLATFAERVSPSVHWGFGSRPSTPPPNKSVKGDDASGLPDEARDRGKVYRQGRKERRRKATIFITKHVAEIMQRQEFLVKLARAFMMFAAPTHRLQAQIQATARVLDLEVSTLYLPNVMLISFGDAGTSTSNLKFIQQGSSLDLGKLLDAHRLYWKVIHDKISVSSASASLDFLMRKPPLYHGWQTVLLGGLCSSSICSLAFSGSFVDSLISLPLGSLLVLVQNISARNELYTNVFEITIATLLSFFSAALASTSWFCYAAVASSSVVLILPGFIVLSGSLELASRQIVSGAVRLCFAIIYSLFLGFGIAMGADVYSRMTGLSVVGPADYTCGSTHKADGPWWQRTVSIWWAFLCVPLYSLFLSLRNQAPLLGKELGVTIFISCGGWAANYFAGLTFVGRPDIQSALGAFAVGIVANTYARFSWGNAYVVMITGILFQLPSGLANGGLLTFAANDNKGQQFESYQAGFQVALQLVAVGIGLTVGLFTSVVIVHPLGGSRRSAAGIFSL